MHVVEERVLGGPFGTGVAAAVPVPVPTGPTFPSGTVRIIDEAAGISYPFLGEGWFEWDLGPQYELSEISGPKGRFFQHIRQTATTWDGSDPIRRMSPESSK